jgi:hypothetical protein
VRPKVYLLCGMRMRSDVPLHLPEAEGAEWDLDVRYGNHCKTARRPPGEVIA